MDQQDSRNKRRSPVDAANGLYNTIGEIKTAAKIGRLATAFNPWMFIIGGIVLVLVVFGTVLTGGGTGAALSPTGGGSGGTGGAGNNGGSNSSGGTVGTEYGWPTTGIIDQGPLGASSHLALYNGNGFHGEAIDIANPSNPPVVSTINGKVQKVWDCTGPAKDCNAGYGNEIDLTDATGKFRIMYAHLLDFAVSSGSTVVPGTILGHMGNTGFSTGTHLHFEFRTFPPLAPPYIPQAITPPNCDFDPASNTGLSCNPYNISVSAAAPTPTPTTALQDQYWFVLDRVDKREYLYKGEPGNKNNSTLAHVPFIVNPGSATEPTPLPSNPPGYWTINAAAQDAPANTGAPYFLHLDIPFLNANNGPATTECNGGQCHWSTSGTFGLHGSSDIYPVDGANPNGTYGSGGCIRHYYTDIVWLWDNLHDIINTHAYPLRYYIIDRWNPDVGIVP